MEVIQKNQAAYRHSFGFDEWRRACEVGLSFSLDLLLNLPVAGPCLVYCLCMFWHLLESGHWHFALDVFVDDR